jgi:hypothetical protein
MEMNFGPHWLPFVALFSLLACSFAAAQDVQTNVTYICKGERLLVESCTMRDLSDTSSCLVQHPDRPKHNCFAAYTNETRGTLKKMIPTCKQLSAQELAKVQAFQKKQQDTQDAAMKEAMDSVNAPPAAPMASSGETRSRVVTRS